jgi:hypothetical protein
MSAAAAPGKAAGAASVRPAAGATRYDRLFGNIYYKIPAGYRAVQTQGGVVMVRQVDLTSGDLGGVLLLTTGFALPTSIKAELRTNRPNAISAIAIASGGLAEDPDAKLSDPQLANDPAKDGYSGYLIASRSKDAATGDQRFTQYAIYLVGDRAEVAMRIGYGSQERLEPLGSGFDALLQSMEFRSAGAPPPARLAAALPTDLAVITPKPKPASSQGAGAATTRSGGGGRSCAVRYRQQCSNVYQGTSPGPFGYARFSYNCLPVPYTPPGCK